MATFPFTGTGTILGEFTVDDVIVKEFLAVGENRLRTAFPYPALETWRRHALNATASISALDTQGRTVVLYAHEADLASMFLDLTQLDPEALAGHYNFKQKAATADQALAVIYPLQTQALNELGQQGVPVQHRDLIRTRLESATYNHRVAGVCAAVYLTGLLLEQAEAIA